MTYGVAIQVPETPITEDWTWITDINVAYDGSEGRLPLLRYPRRSFSGNFAFDDVDSLRRHVAMMTKRYKTEFGFPLWQYQTKLKTAALIGDDTVSVNAKRGDFREGQTVIVIEGTKFETVVVDSFDAVSVTFTTELTKSYSARAVVCPVVTVFTNTNASISRRGVDGSGTSSFSYAERMPTLPFVSPLNEATIATFDGLPLLDKTPIGTDFSGAVATGLTAIEYTALTDLISPWTNEKWGYNLTFKANLIGNVDDFEWWQLFAETIQGSFNPFLFPTNRNDLPVRIPVEPLDTFIDLVGDQYSQHYWGQECFERIFIDTTAGRHYAKVTGVASVGGNDRITIDPAVPFNAFPKLTTVKAGGQRWKYKLIGLADTTDYSAPGFNDAAWDIAQAPFGTGGEGLTFGPVKTNIGNFKRLWMRGTFNCKYDPSIYTRLVLFVDDHYKVWFNGVELGSGGSNDPMGDLTVFLKSFVLPDGLLVAGENHVALRADDNVGGQSFADIRLEALLDEQRVGFLLKVRNDNDKITLAHSGLSTQVGISIRTTE